MPATLPRSRRTCLGPRAWPATTLYELLSHTAGKHGARKRADVPDVFRAERTRPKRSAGPSLHARVTQAANMFRALGVQEDRHRRLRPAELHRDGRDDPGRGDGPGIVNPDQPAAGARADRRHPARDQGQGRGHAQRNSPRPPTWPRKWPRRCATRRTVQVVLEVDLLRYLTGIKKLIVPFIRPKNPTGHRARVLDWDAEMARRTQATA